MSRRIAPAGAFISISFVQQQKLSDSSKKGSDAILKQAKGGEASSEQIEECAKILVGTTDNVLRAINTSREVRL